jgi:hypothetical protein
MPLKRTPKLRPTLKRLGESQRRLFIGIRASHAKAARLATGNCRKTDGRTVSAPRERCAATAVPSNYRLKAELHFMLHGTSPAGGSSCLDSFRPPTLEDVRPVDISTRSVRFPPPFMPAPFVCCKFGCLLRLTAILISLNLRRKISSTNSANSRPQTPSSCTTVRIHPRWA